LLPKLIDGRREEREKKSGHQKTAFFHKLKTFPGGNLIDWLLLLCFYVILCFTLPRGTGQKKTERRTFFAFSAPLISGQEET